MTGPIELPLRVRGKTYNPTVVLTKCSANKKRLSDATLIKYIPFYNLRLNHL